jgi:SIR2-like domain
LEVDPPIAQLDENRFPGNISAFGELTNSLATGEVLGFVGAGASAELLPTWSSLLRKMIFDAAFRGDIREDDKVYLEGIVSTDPLECASLLEDQIGREHFRSIVAKELSLNSQFTAVQASLVSVGLSGFITLNYDSCLEAAIVKKLGMNPSSGNHSNRFALADWRKRAILSDKNPPVLHLHGEATDPDTIVFSRKDYVKIYDEGDVGEFLQEILRSSRCLFVGFGFSDPYLDFLMQRGLRTLASEPIHFAFIGLSEDVKYNILMRSTFKTKYRITPVFYSTTTKSREDGTEYQDHSAIVTLLEVLRELREKVEGSSRRSSDDLSDNTQMVAPSGSLPPEVDLTESSFLSVEEHLFKSPAGRTLYVDPVLMNAPRDDPFADRIGRSAAVSLEDIVKSTKDIAIISPPEAGATTLSKSLYREFRTVGVSALWADARLLPNYKKKLERHFSISGTDAEHVLILDNFMVTRDDRLLKEIQSLSIFNRIIVFIRNNEMYTGSPSFSSDMFSGFFEPIYHWHCSRPEIRELAENLFDSTDELFIMRIVDKTYFDLIGLCMPLTPTNIIMYLMILYKEGDYHPLNRVQIVDRYLTDILRSPGEYYEYSFSSRNKLDLLSDFSNHLYSKKVGSWDERFWYDYCNIYKQDKLIEFDESKILSELFDSRIFIKVGMTILFKFSYFFSYFLGRFISHNPSALADFLKEQRYFDVEALIEVVTGLTSENGDIIDELTGKLEDHLKMFFKTYVPEEFDPLKEFEWPQSASEGEMWAKIEDGLAQGPRPSKEIDQVKKSVLAERRSERQQVTINEFRKMEERLVALKSMLQEALKNSEYLSGERKKKAATAILRALAVIYRVGLLFADQLANQRWFFWNGILFVNRVTFQESVSTEHRIATIITGLSLTVASKASEGLGVRKLGPIFKALNELEDAGGIMRLLRFELILVTKPDQWDEILQKIIVKMFKNEFYLWVVLQRLLAQLHEEVNTGADRNKLKKLVALVQTKRELGKNNPGNSVVSKVLGRLEESAYFEKKDRVSIDEGGGGEPKFSKS